MKEKTLQLIPWKLKLSIKGYYEQIYANKLNNLEEIHKFIETYNLPRLNHEEIENLNKPIMNKDIQLVIKSFLTKKNPGPDGFSGKFSQIFKEELIPVFSNSLKKLKVGERKKHSQTYFEACIILITKSNNKLQN